MSKKPRIHVEDLVPRKSPRVSRETELVGGRTFLKNQSIEWPTDICMNPIRYMAFDCPGCQHYKPCVCYRKDNYKKYKPKIQEVEPEEVSSAPIPPRKKTPKLPPVTSKKLSRKERREARKLRKAKKE